MVTLMLPRTDLFPHFETEQWDFPGSRANPQELVQRSERLRRSSQQDLERIVPVMREHVSNSTVQNREVYLLVFEYY